MKYRYLFLNIFLLLISCGITIATYSPALKLSPSDKPEKTAGFHVKHSPHTSSHNVYDSRTNFQCYTAVDFERSFAGYTSKQILEQHELLMFDEFVIFAKTLPEYAQTIKALHKKLRRKGGAAKFFESCIGTYSNKLADRIAFLYQSIQEQERKELAVKEQQQCKQQENQKYKDKLVLVAQRCTRGKARLAALASTQHHCDYRPLRSIVVDDASLVCARDFGIPLQELTTGYMNAYEYLLHTEFIAQLGELTHLADTYQLMPKENVLLEVIGQGVALGIKANTNHDPEIATQLADFVWEVLDIAKGVAEGGILGAYNTACFAKNLILHPVERAVAFLNGLGSLACALTKVIGIPVHLGGLCAAGNVEQAYKETQEIYTQTTRIIQEKRAQLAALSNREIAKQTTAFATEIVLTGKALSLCQDICSRVTVLLADVLEVLRKEPLFEYVVATAEGPIHHMSYMTKNIVTNLMSNSKRGTLKFSPIAAQRMEDASRMIPVHILDSILKNPMHIVPDPKGLSKASMYYAQMWVNKKLYNVEVLYDKLTNTISHFLYRQDKLGPLPKIK